MSADLTVYRLERELLELLEYRDDVAAEVHVTEAGEHSRQETLEAVDARIQEYVKAHAVAKGERVIAAVRECKARADMLDEEIARLAEISGRWRRREHQLKQAAQEAMAATLDPGEIEAANQGTVLMRVQTRLGQLRLCKSPPRVEIAVPELIPEEHQKCMVSMRMGTFKALLSSWRHVIQLKSTTEDKAAIGERLKAGEAVPGATLVRDSVHLRLD